MAELFKDKFNHQMITLMGRHFERAWPEFNHQGFYNKCVDGLENLELKERIARISEALSDNLPANDFEHAVSVLRKSLAPDGASWEEGITGWGTLPLNHYVSSNGLAHFDTSMAFFKTSTTHFSAEFDIRFFILRYPQQTLKLLEKWSEDPNYHVRRLVSEGTRPRLPWAIKLQPFIDDPSPLLPLLTSLKDDQQEYVRRSVANSLNDIAKDHPDWVATVAQDWLLNANRNRERLVRHACRTLIKQGHQPTLKALGYKAPNVNLVALIVKQERVRFGDSLTFEVTLHSTSKESQKLIVDYAIHYQKANGGTSAKVFKWKNITLKANAQLSATKKHAIKPITTRKYYNGEHFVEILVNGVPVGKASFELFDVK